MKLGAWLGCVSVLVLATIAACSPPTTQGDAGADVNSCESMRDHATVMTRLDFLSQMPAGVSQGFDLDNRTAPDGVEATCFQASLIDPEGRTGIDNQLSLLVPLLDMQTGRAVGSIVHDAINNGQLLVGISLEHLDDRVEDSCVDVVFRRLSGNPTIGTDMQLNAHQTFDIVADAPVTRTRGELHNGMMEVGPFELPLPVAVLDARFTILLHGARVRLRIDEDGNLSGLIGGGVAVDEVAMITRGLNIPSGFMSQIEGFVRSVADLDRQGGECRQFSAALSFTSTAAFLN